MLFYVPPLLPIAGKIENGTYNTNSEDFFSSLDRARIPNLRSLFLFNPDLSLVATLPIAVKVHIIGAFCLVLLLPFTRLVHFLSVPLQYVWRPPQVVVWNQYMLLKLGISMWIVLPVTITLTVVIMGMMQDTFKISLSRQYRSFKNKHNWIMTWLYTMTFGSFIGYSAAFPLLIKIVFGELPDGSANPNAIDPFAYAWLGPLVGSLIRPVGGWLSDKLGGAVVTQWDTVVMIGSTL
jgi:nitrate/nitrite transporter NarK